MSKDLGFVIKKNLFFHQTHSFLVQDHLNIIFCFTPTYFLYSGVQSELCQASKIEFFWKLVNSWKLLPIFARSFTLSYIIDRFKPLILSLIESNLGLVFSLLQFLKHFFFPSIAIDVDWFHWLGMKLVVMLRFVWENNYGNCITCLLIIPFLK